MHVLDEAGLRAWARSAHESLLRVRDRINDLNVFPIADADTGTNLVATMRSATAALEEVPPGAGWSAAAASLCRGALVGARGNSGVILAQFLQGFADPEVAREGGLEPHQLRVALDRAQALAYRAVLHPVEGTMLSVARAAAGAAASAAGGMAEVVESAVGAARRALGETTDQLEALRVAGVVDAGGVGVLVVLQALRDVVRGRESGEAEIIEFLDEVGGRVVGGSTACAMGTAVPGDGAGPAYEVMYVLRAPEGEIAQLRERLAALGDSVAVVGLEDLWNVHVHVDDAGAAIAAGLALGQPNRIRITRLHPEPRTSVASPRAVIAVAHGAGTAALLRSAGARVVEAHDGGPTSAELMDSVSGAAADEIIIVPATRQGRDVAEAAAASARRIGMLAAVIPCRSVVQSLAAIGVHESSARFEDAVVSMTRAATATRYGGVTVSRREALTSGGTCRPGDVLGLVEGDIAIVGSDEQVVACAIIDRLLASSGELVTLVVGAQAAMDLGHRVEAAVRRSHPGVDVLRLDGGQPTWPLIIGVE